MKLKNLKGTRDFYPEVKFVQDFIFDRWRSVALRFGFQDFEGPLLESAELWRIKSGDELPEQMYCFRDKNDRDVAIRPEMTPTLARMVAAKQRELVKPIKWYTIGRFWRYERPQAGRLREFFQLNVDILGTESQMADAEVIMTAIEIMKELDCSREDFYIRIGNRKVIESLMVSLDIKGSLQAEVARLIDKREKIGEDNFKKSLKDADLNDTQIKNLIKILDLDDVKKIDESTLDDKGKEGLNELKELFSYLDAYGALEFCKLDMNIMRGLDYYTSTVFEVFDTRKEFRAIAGGGRYEDLVSDFGGEKCPGIGYGMGDIVLELFLRKINKIPEYKRELDYFIAVVSDEVQKDALRLASRLREKYSVDIDFMGRKLKKQFDYANKLGAKKVIVVGPDEIKNGKVVVKDMGSGTEEKVKIKDF